MFGEFSPRQPSLPGLAGQVFAGPVSGGAAPGVFRALATSDIPSLPEGKITGLVADLAAKGTVSSVGLSLPGEFTVSGSPVTGSGTLSVSKANQAANAIYAGPASGSAGVPAFRAIVSADLPLALAPIDLASYSWCGGF